MATVVRRIKLVLRVIAGTIAFAAYVWYRAVLAVPRVRRRKAARRAARGALLTARGRRPERSRTPA